LTDVPSGAAARQHVTAVLSPHLDDAVLSLGSWIAAETQAGVEVMLVTIFGGDPASDAPAGDWDARCGFETAGAATRVRRSEDAEACALVGARPVWLPFLDGQYRADDGEDIWTHLSDAVGDAGRVLVPGFPLAHADHRRVADLVDGRLQDRQSVGLYLEQPYATSPAGASGTWVRVKASRSQRAAKRRACAAYVSQMRMLRSRVRRMAIAEAFRGREWIQWVRPPDV
jgi:LmbE family N-acetylglucosaminyl deacetylase